MKGLRFADTQESCFEARKRSHMGCATLLCGRFVDVQELRFKSENLSDMCCDKLQGCPFANCQKWYFQASKCSNMGSAVVLGGRSNGVLESCFETAKLSDMRLEELQVVY